MVTTFLFILVEPTLVPLEFTYFLFRRYQLIFCPLWFVLASSTLTCAEILSYRFSMC